MGACLTPLNLCAARFTRLETDGEADWGADAYFVKVPISIAETPTIDEGQLLQQRNGCGTLCAQQQQPDQWTGVGLTVTLCEDDYELFAMFTGGTVIYSAGIPIGWTAPANGVNPPPVLVEGWQQTVEGDNVGTLNGVQQYKHHVWPYVTFVPGDKTLENAITQTPFVGKSTVNNQIGATGPFDDWPGAVNGPKGEWLTATLPTAFCSGASLAS